MRVWQDDRLARVALSRIVEPGDPRLLASISSIGPVETLQQLADSHPDLAELQAETQARSGGLEPERILAIAARQGIRFVTPADDEWPHQLADLEQPRVQGRGGVPVGLWVRGPQRLDTLAGSVAVVGARTATGYGASVAGDIAAQVAGAGRPVVSGAAFGIDQAAHRGALGSDGSTVAVLACGADRIYPEAHRDLIEHLATRHAVVSEAPPGWSPMRMRFLSRNRLIAALTSGTVVVEAALRSGALNTANWAHQLNRPVMGVPGPVTSAQSQGVHQLVRVGAAGLVTTGPEVLEMVAESGQHLLEVPRGPETTRDRLDPVDRQVLDAVPVSRAVPSVSIARTAGIGPGTTDAVLVRLQEAGLVRSDGHGWRLAGLALP
ncbi:DNA processing protein [Nocardioides marinisabuli]|uniref:DNA processing protein n=1 Tax=Nocardioides marinisabuli TaxID=419476 RepID=A0A7Y9JS89_9ACTN|nr:DNA-processing protein DprA [Nocardioides marinisabuli]NYD58343.1 DNA processing protein [Nocardioides marinisabuli]